jgi:hypothetical protein
MVPDFLLPTLSSVKDSSVVAVQIFDQRKFKRRDQGFLGVVNIQVANYLDLELGGHGTFSRLGDPSTHPSLSRLTNALLVTPRRGGAIRPEEVQ